ncbi:MAG: hypothetical protein ACD_79C00801G0003 [uncultured bacterium]|nr:MAG: hypothetical protein ACD_79C00801G0003 [uncultured bacterium]
MKCPICKTESFSEKTLESGLLSLHCDNCNGNWIKSFQYWIWREQNGKDLPELPPEQGLVKTIQDSKSGKFCPECNKFLFRYKVGHGTDFNLDRCNTCGGTWFDKSEWDVLKSRNLHDDIHFIFSAPWQSKVQKEESEKSKENLLKNKIGEKDYLKVQEIKKWLINHSNKNEIISYITESVK